MWYISVGIILGIPLGMGFFLLVSHVLHRQMMYYLDIWFVCLQSSMKADKPAREERGERREEVRETTAPDATRVIFQDIQTDPSYPSENGGGSGRWEEYITLVNQDTSPMPALKRLRPDS